MKIVIDTNIIISAIIKNSKTREIILKNKLKLIAPNKLEEEILKYKEEISKKAKVDKKVIEIIIKLIMKDIEIIKINDFKDYILDAKNICPDPFDVEFFALSLKYNIPIWTNDKALKSQSKIKILTTQELLSIL